MLIGNQFNFVHVVVELISVGPYAVIMGRGITLLIGTANAGPAMEAVGVTSRADLRAVFGSGDLVDAGELALAQGCNVVYLIRILGDGFARAEVSVTDSQDSQVGKFVANGDGIEGNSGVVKIEDGPYDAQITQVIQGTGQETPYSLTYNDITESTKNRIRVDNVEREIVYDIQNLAAGKAYIDQDAGAISFYTGEWPTTASQIEVRYVYRTIKVTLRDSSSTEPPYLNIRSLVQLTAALRYSGVCTFVADVGETHLPKSGTYALTGGSDGSSADQDDYEDAFELALNLPEGIIPTATALLDYEVQAGTYDLVPVLDAYLNMAADKFMPQLGFVSAAPNETISGLLSLKSNFNSIWMTIIGNGWSKYEQDLAPARAGMEAALQLGESAAYELNSMKGINDLLWIMNDTDRETCTYNGIEVIIKKNGIRPYVGITTSTDDNFRRCVDMRTIAFIVINFKAISDRFMHRRRTKAVLNAYKTSIVLGLEDLYRTNVLDYYYVLVTPNRLDRNAVDAQMDIQPVGHIERIRLRLAVGNFTAEVA